MNKKVSHQDLGEFIYDEGLGWYQGSLSADFLNINLFLSTEDQSEVDNIIKEASHLKKNIYSETLSAKKYAAKELVELKNNVWENEDKSKVSLSEFTDRITLESITIYPDNSKEMFFDDDDLFFGHVIIVSVNELGEFKNATISG